MYILNNTYKLRRLIFHPITLANAAKKTPSARTEEEDPVLDFLARTRVDRKTISGVPPFLSMKTDSYFDGHQMGCVSVDRFARVVAF